MRAYDTAARQRRGGEARRGTLATSLDELRSAITRGHSGLREAIDLAAPAWERARRPRPGEDEVWSPRTAAEHVIGADVGFAARVAGAIGVEPPERPALDLATPDAALSALAEAARAVDAVLEAVEPRHLDIETGFAGDVEGVLRLAAGHLREHARQIAGIQ